MEEVLHERVASTSSSSSSSSSSAFSPETSLIVGEALYILRPAMYAAAKKYFLQRRNRLILYLLSIRGVFNESIGLAKSANCFS